MVWKKIRNVFCPQGVFPWMHSHAANPVPLVLDENKGLVRVFFTSRDVESRSYIGYADFDFCDDYRLVGTSPSPVVSPGEPGLFDDSGTAMGCLVNAGDKIYLFYLGWNLRVTVPWLNTIGLATGVSHDGPFRKYSRAPILDRHDIDPFSISYPSILFDGGRYRMWYGSNLSWGKGQSEMRHVIKYAESDDLLSWNRTGQVHIPLIHPGEYAISKPWVIKRNGSYEMWYSFRANGSVSTYRIGYAVSEDGFTWARRDEDAGIDVGDAAWDSEMICYPSVFRLRDTYFMLYNGNGYGKTGFGVAVLQ